MILQISDPYLVGWFVDQIAVTSSHGPNEQAVRDAKALFISLAFWPEMIDAELDGHPDFEPAAVLADEDPPIALFEVDASAVETLAKK